MKKDFKYIFVDLDGTLIRTDLFVESILILIKQNPFAIIQVIFWILQGRSVAKDKVARRVELNVDHLPYESELIDYLKKQKEQKKILILTTASNHRYADKVAKFLGLFDKVIASDKNNNYKGKRKLEAIHEITSNENFVYAGDSSADRPIWNAAHSCIFVNAPNKDVELANSMGKTEKIITRNQSLGLSVLKGMRLHQWAKNVLIFVPLFTSHTYLNSNSLIAASLAFICFSLCASGVYFLNDMLDLEADRRHVLKRFRPLASGELPLPIGIAGAIILPAIAFTLAWVWLPIPFFITLFVYYLFSNAYTFFLKKVHTADVMTLAVLYAIRVVAGAAAISVELSSWLLAFSVFIFVSLAYLKRYVELFNFAEDTDQALGRGYTASDREAMFTLGIASMTVSVLVLALYISSEEVTSVYNSPNLLWFMCLLMLYWGNRIWVQARRGKVSTDPVLFAIKDKVSQMIGVGFLAIIVCAKYIQI